MSVTDAEKGFCHDNEDAGAGPSDHHHPYKRGVIVTLAGRVIADSRNALTLKEASYPAVQYIPRADVDMALLARSDHNTYCPYKGDCSYYSIPSGGERSGNAVWTYEDAYPAVAVIKDHLAFYPSRVDAIEIKEP